MCFAAGLGRPRAEHGGGRQNPRGVATPSSRPLRFSLSLPPPFHVWEKKTKNSREEAGEGPEERRRRLKSSDAELVGAGTAVATWPPPPL